MNIETVLTIVGERYSPLVVGLVLVAAMLSFLARHRAQTVHGRIRESGLGSIGMAAALAGLALFYGVLYGVALEPVIRQGVVRILLTLLAAASVGFNWGGVSVAWRDASNGIKRRL